MPVNRSRPAGAACMLDNDDPLNPRRGQHQDSVFLSMAPVTANPGVRFEAQTRLGRFVIQSHLGSGRLGQVYLAVDTVSGRTQAVKIAERGPSGLSAASSSLLREKAAYDLIQDHRHVLKVHDLHTARWGGLELLILSMEYGDGGTFLDWLEQRRGNAPAYRREGLCYFRQICLGVAAIHAAGLVHGDLKPANVFRVQGVWKVSDLGASRGQASGAEDLDTARLNVLSSPHGGTPIYMSPEQCSVDPCPLLAPSADVYSLGIILYQVLDPQARPPFDGDVWSVREQHRQAPPPLPSTAGDVAGVVVRCLEKNPSSRYPTAAELFDDLEAREHGQQAVTRCGPVAEIVSQWQEATQAFKELRLADAQRLCQRILETEPTHRDAANLLEELQARERRVGELYAELRRRLSIGTLDQCCLLLEEAVDVYPNYPSGRQAQANLQARVNEYLNALRHFQTELARGRWSAACHRLALAVQLNPAEVDIRRVSGRVAGLQDRVQTTRDAIERAIGNGDFDQALLLARNVDAWVKRLSVNLSTSEGGQPS